MFGKQTIGLRGIERHRRAGSNRNDIDLPNLDESIASPDDPRRMIWPGDMQSNKIKYDRFPANRRSWRRFSHILADDLRAAVFPPFDKAEAFVSFDHKRRVWCNGDDAIAKR